jgi:signal transduction histidine kinase
VDRVCAFFTANMVAIYFAYGLAFFTTGLVVWLEASRSSTVLTARVLPLLAGFGIVHGSHEWLEMFLQMAPREVGGPIEILRIVVLAVSFILLAEFGVRLLTMDTDRSPWRAARWVLLAVFVIGMALAWIVWGGQEEVWSVADAWCRYSLAIPGALLAAGGVLRRSRLQTGEDAAVSRDMRIGGAALLIYGVVGQVFVGQSPLPPSTIVNSAWFMDTLHFPVQLLRSAMAVVVAISTVRTLRLFERQRQRRLMRLSSAQADAQRLLREETAERQALQRDLLHHAVLAQEAERQHIARELHDEVGQALTAITWGLAQLEEALAGQGNGVQERARKLRSASSRVMVELRQLTTRLRPALLDELGLVPALIAYADECSNVYSFDVEVTVSGKRRRLPSELETTLYRIVQESLTNVAKHAQASNADVRLDFDDDGVTLAVIDDGSGMDTETAQRAAACGTGFGLAGICERVILVDGHLDLHSTLGTGTQVRVKVPVPREEEALDPNPIAAS